MTRFNICFANRKIRNAVLLRDLRRLAGPAPRPYGGETHAGTISDFSSAQAVSYYTLAHFEEIASSSLHSYHASSSQIQ